VFNETRSILEPAGAVAVAGAKAYLQREGLQVLPRNLFSFASATSLLASALPIA
jgi:threonine dehydratase